jgi:hypothetical protein
VELALAVCDGYRIPKPTREADHFVEEVKRRRYRGGFQSGTGWRFETHFSLREVRTPSL